jgi:hypothetical protein
MWEGGCSTGRTDDVIATISSFKNFLIENCSFKQDFLHDIRSLQVNEEGTPDSTPLTLRQLHHIREYNKRDIIDEYIFELFFQLGIDKKDLSICVPQNADYETHFFRYKNKAIRYNERISQILAVIKNATLYDLTTKMQNIDYHYFEQVTIHLIKNIPGMWEKERPLRYSDILKSHKIYMLKCPNPNCEELSENFQQNWVLLKAEPDTEYRLVCSRCKGKPYEC